MGHQSVASEGLLRDLLSHLIDHTQSPWVPLTCQSPRGTCLVVLRPVLLISVVAAEWGMVGKERWSHSGT